MALIPDPMRSVQKINRLVNLRRLFSIIGFLLWGLHAGCRVAKDQSPSRIVLGKEGYSLADAVSPLASISAKDAAMPSCERRNTGSLSMSKCPSASEKTASKEPVGEEPVSKEPVSKEPASKEPASKEPASKEPASKEPASKEPASEEPAGKKPAGGEAAGGEAAGGEAAGGEAAGGEAAGGEAAGKEPAGKEPAGEEPASEEPASEEPAGKEPASKEPASGEAASGEAASGEAASGEAASGEAAGGEAAGGEPVSEELAGESSLPPSCVSSTASCTSDQMAVHTNTVDKVAFSGKQAEAIRAGGAQAGWLEIKEGKFFVEGPFPVIDQKEGTILKVKYFPKTAFPSGDLGVVAENTIPSASSNAPPPPPPPPPPPSFWQKLTGKEPKKEPKNAASGPNRGELLTQIHEGFKLNRADPNIDHPNQKKKGKTPAGVIKDEKEKNIAKILMKRVKANTEESVQEKSAEEILKIGMAKRRVTIYNSDNENESASDNDEWDEPYGSELPQNPNSTVVGSMPTSPLVLEQKKAVVPQKNGAPLIERVTEGFLEKTNSNDISPERENPGQKKVHDRKLPQNSNSTKYVRSTSSERSAKRSLPGGSGPGHAVTQELQEKMAKRELLKKSSQIPSPLVLEQKEAAVPQKNGAPPILPKKKSGIVAGSSQMPLPVSEKEPKKKMSVVMKLKQIFEGKSNNNK